MKQKTIKQLQLRTQDVDHFDQVTDQVIVKMFSLFWSISSELILYSNPDDIYPNT